MLGINKRVMRTCPLLVLILTLWCSTAIAVEIFPENAEREKVGALYSNLGQNIGDEASLYAEYSDYRQNLRLEIFREEIKSLNLARDEMILMIRFLEKNLPKHVHEHLSVATDSPTTAFSPGYLSALFSHWRPFYFLISGGFFLINGFLLMAVLCVACRKNDINFMMNDFKNRISGEIGGRTTEDFSDYDLLHKKYSEHKKAA